MKPVEQHTHKPDVSFDGGDLDCGGGLLLLIRRHIDPLPPGGLLEILSTEPTVEEELPSWCRMTGNELVSLVKQPDQASYLVSKGSLASRATDEGQPAQLFDHEVTPVVIPEELPAPVAVPPIEPLAVMGIGSWPRPRWMLQAIHDHLEGTLPEEDYQDTADDAVRLAITAQERAGVDIVTDGEQRRDSYAAFVGGRLDNCQLIPLSDLAAMVEHPEEFEQELRALDIPASEVRHPVVYGELSRSQPLAVHEFEFARQVTDRPIKVALPGPYLLTRTMWLDCLEDLPYRYREELAVDIARVLQEELHFLLAAGVSLVQFDEPVLTEVVFGHSSRQRSFMCGALSEKLPPEEELAFATELFNAVVEGLPRERLALHICRGNWTKDESIALRGDFGPLINLLRDVDVGTLFLELATDRAGGLEVLQAIPDDKRIAVGVVNQKLDHIEPVNEVEDRIRKAINLFGKDRVLLTPDCGFATFADNPVASAKVAEGKLKAIAEAAARFK